jgi:hypothetical protein
MSIDISKNIRLGGDCIRGIGMMLLCIQDLRFDDCWLVTSEDVAGLGEIMGRGRKSLVSLSLEKCVKVRNSAVKEIIENCTRLTYLNLSGLHFLTNKTIEYIDIKIQDKNCRLHTLDISNCNRMTRGTKLQFKEINTKFHPSFHLSY